jgi:diketogulonate reductase-like aldo/keto reductase
VDLLAVTRHNITLEPEVYEEFCKYAGKKGIKVSTWVNLKMKEFIEEEQMIEEIRKKRS